MNPVISTIRIAGRDVPRVGFGTLYITAERGFGAALRKLLGQCAHARGVGGKFR